MFALLLPLFIQDITILADTLHIGNGQVLSHAVVSLENGKIQSVTEGVSHGFSKDAQQPEGTYYLPEAHLTPGLVDAYSFLGVHTAGYTVDETKESGAAHALSLTADLDASGFLHAVENGVTSAFLSPDSTNVFGGLAAFVKTSGGNPFNLYRPALSAAKVVNAAAALKISLGLDASKGNHSPWGKPQDFRSRRPTTRMGTVWEIRRQFYRALSYKEERGNGLADANADLDIMLQVLDGRLPLRIQARRNNDVQTALRLKDEFQIPHMIIEEGSESWRAKELLAAAGVPVVVGPAYDEVSRAVATGPTLAELRLLANPPAVCCEGLEEPGHEDHAPDAHAVKITGFAQDLLLATTTPRYDAAAGSTFGRQAEGEKATPATPALLWKAGVSCAIGSAEAHDSALSEASLIHQARTAVQWGLSPEQALVMVTSKAAMLCGQAKHVGQVAAGFDADLVLWSDNPLVGTSRPLLVFVDGRLAADLR